jgi:arabinogalactan endo-1,4-beta-galactosidase
MKFLFFLPFILLSFIQSCKKDNSENPDPGVEKAFYRGADVSFLPEINEVGTIFYDSSGQQKQVLDILKKSGVNTIRLRLWHTPANNHSGLEEVSAFAKQIKEKGFKLFITIHYSNTWADPGNQKKPAAWEGLTLAILSDSVYNYTKRVVHLLDPDIIEVGNEISNGFLWPDGKISNQADFITLLKSGIKGARDATSDKRKILIHSATLDVSEWFFNILKTNNVDYDILGVSYYPFWTKITPAVAVQKLNSLSQLFYKDAMFAETAYPFTLAWNDYTNNIIGTQDQLLTGYPATPEGQKLLLTDLRQALEKTTKGIGFCYWAPEWVAFKGTQSTSGSSWENMALFDFNSKALPAMQAFNLN